MRFDDNKKVSRVLIAAGILAYAVWIFLFAFYVPTVARSLAAWASASGRESVIYAVLLGLAEAGGIPLAVAIGFYIAICRRIGDGRSFCRENVRDLNRIAVLLLCSAAFFFLIPLFSGREKTSILIAVIGLAVAAVSVLAWALGKLVKHAVVLKEENDLTI